MSNPIAREWPNKLGFDVGTTEVWIYSSSFGVHTFHRGSPSKYLSVPFSRTTDPIEAAALCRIEGEIIDK